MNTQFVLGQVVCRCWDVVDECCAGAGHRSPPAPWWVWQGNWGEQWGVRGPGHNSPPWWAGWQGH